MDNEATSDGHIPFTLALTGDTVSPEAVNIAQLNELMVALQKLVTAAIRDVQGPASKVRRELSSLSLVEVRPGSVNYGLATSPAGRDALAYVSGSLNSGNLTQLSPAVRSYLTELSTVGSRIAAHVELRDFDSEGSVIDVSGLTAPPWQVVRGETVLYARCERVGGVQPAASIRTLADNVRLTVVLPTDIVKELAGHLYEVVAFEGQATWRTDTWELIGFKPRGFQPQPKASVSESFRRLAEAAGSTWAVIDPVEFVRQLRSEGDE